MPGTGEYLVIGAIAAVVTFAVTPIVIRLAKRMGWVVAPDERRVHTGFHGKIEIHASRLSARRQKEEWGR